MSKSRLIIGFVLAVLLIGVFILSPNKNKKGNMEEQNSANTIQLTSSDFADNSEIPAKFTCKGENINPNLSINNVPSNTQSLALIMHDPDAVGSDWAHWLVWNISPDTNRINENSVPQGAIEGTTSFGKPGWGGPCPPAGTGSHRYMFKLYALDAKLDLDQSADRTQLENAMRGHVLDETLLTGLFGK